MARFVLRACCLLDSRTAGGHLANCCEGPHVVQQAATRQLKFEPLLSQQVQVGQQMRGGNICFTPGDSLAWDTWTVAGCSPDTKPASRPAWS